MAKLPEPIELKLPIAIRNEYITPYLTTIRIRRRLGTTFLATGGDFTISTCPDGREHRDAQEETKLFSVESDLAPGGFLRQRRHFRNASGLPIFNLLMKGSGATWLVQLPGDSTSKPMAVPSPRWDLFTNKMHVYVKNSADNYAEVKLEVRGQVMF
ncbi:hypothetical protein PHISCL_05871 [Aspergillus sclerotialis]|uniref:Uncharacterized protein n=1 Tax=Aspergillus sclerotialis TaxID=2070753 RepID=A0A3A2ZGP5_9EURO|nr:hypothetical protein PHISCL_05871 [Aspergillus sclerotialis]